MSIATLALLAIAGYALFSCVLIIWLRFMGNNAPQDESCVVLDCEHWRARGDIMCVKHRAAADALEHDRGNGKVRVASD